MKTANKMNYLIKFIQRYHGKVVNNNMDPNNRLKLP